MCQRRCNVVARSCWFACLKQNAPCPWRWRPPRWRGGLSPPPGGPCPLQRAAPSSPPGRRSMSTLGACATSHQTLHAPPSWPSHSRCSGSWPSPPPSGPGTPQGAAAPGHPVVVASQRTHRVSDTAAPSHSSATGAQPQGSTPRDVRAARLALVPSKHKRGCWPPQRPPCVRECPARRGAVLSHCLAPGNSRTLSVALRSAPAAISVSTTSRCPWYAAHRIGDCCHCETATPR